MTLSGPHWDKSKVGSCGMGQFGSEVPIGATFIFSRLLSLKNISGPNFKIPKIIIKKFHKMLLILSVEKDAFSILVNGTFLYFCPFST